MKTETIKASQLDHTYVGLKAIIQLEDGTVAAGGISYVRHVYAEAIGALSGPHYKYVWVYIAGGVVSMPPDNCLEVEMTPTQVKAEGEAVNRPVGSPPLPLHRPVGSTAEEVIHHAILGAKMGALGQWSCVNGRHLFEQPTVDNPRTGHVLGVLLTSTLLLVGAGAVLVLGVQAPPLSGYTFVAMMLLAVIAALMLRLIQVSAQVQRWVL